MKVIIQQDQTKATDTSTGRQYDIVGIKIPKKGLPSAFYDVNTSFYKAAAASGTTSEAYISDSNSNEIILL